MCLTELEAHMFRRSMKCLLLIVIFLTFALPQASYAQESKGVTAADLQNLIDALKIIEYNKTAQPKNVAVCTFSGLLAQSMIRRVIDEGITSDLQIQELARTEWPKVEVKVGMTWQALCQGGNLK